MRCLEIGPGAERLPGFETLNAIATPWTDHVGDARRPQFADGTFDLVYSAHCIEHVEWYEVEATIAQWVRILRPGGVLEVHTVDAYRLLRAIVDLEETGACALQAGAWKREWTGGDPYLYAVGRLLNYAKGGAHGRLNLHRAIITPQRLRRHFAEAGLVGIEDAGEPRGAKKHRSVNFGIRGRKPC